MRFFKIIFLSSILLGCVTQLKAQEYSSIDKARLLMDANSDILNYYIKNNDKFDSIAIAKGVSVAGSFSYFRDITLADTLLNLPSPFAKLSLMLQPAYNVPVRDFNINNIVKFKLLENAFPLDTIQSLTPATAPASLIVQLAQPTSDLESAQVVGVQSTPSGGNFSTNLLQATADLLLDRGRQELANSFYAELTNKLDSVVALNTMFPNATQLLVSRDPYTLPSMGSAWKGAFELDLQALPQNLIKFLEIELPDEEDKLEVLGAFINMLEDLKKGDNLYEAINSMYNSLSDDNSFAQPVRLACLLSLEMTMSRTVGDPNTGKVWATLDDFRAMGANGQAVFLGFLVKKIEQEGFSVDGLTSENLGALLSKVSSLLSALNKGEAAIANLSADGSNLVNQFGSLSDAATEIFTDFKALLAEISIVADTNNSDGPGEDLASLEEEFENINEIFNVIKRAQQAVVEQDYGKLLPIALELFKLMDNKAYTDIETKFTELRKEIVADLQAYNKQNNLDNLINYLDSAGNFEFEGNLDLFAYIQGIKAKVNQLFDKDNSRKTISEVYYIVSSELDKLKLDVPEDFMRIAMFVIDITEAKTADEIQGILDAAILPVGSYRMKRQPYSRAIFLQGFAGFTGGYELPDHNSVSQTYDGLFGGLFLPVGIEYAAANRSCGVSETSCGYNGIFISIIDVGAIGSFNLSSNSSDLAIPSLTIQNVLSPGLFYTNGLRNAPITWGVGARFAPELREISVDPAGAMATLNGTVLSSVQFNAFLAVDIPLARVFKIKR